MSPTRQPPEARQRRSHRSGGAAPAPAPGTIRASREPATPPPRPDLARARRLGHRPVAPPSPEVAGERRLRRKVGFEFETSWEMAATQHDQGPPNGANERNLPTKKKIQGEDGWQLHADYNRVPVAEWITDPVEEADWLEGWHRVYLLEEITGRAVAKAGRAGRDGDWLSVHKTAKGDVWLRKGDPEMRAAPQMTAGFRLDRIPEVMKAMGARHKTGSKQLLAKPEGEGVEKMARLVNRARGQASRFVRRWSQEAPEFDPLGAVQMNAVPEGFEGALALLGMYALLGQHHAPLEYAKELSPLMSRTNLGALPEAIRNSPRLLEGVLYVAGTDDANGRLFKEGFQEGDQVVARGPTLRAWVEGIRDGDDPLRAFSGGNMSAIDHMEGVTTTLEQGGLNPVYTSAAQGPILELRGMQEGLPRTQWADFASNLQTWLQEINNPDQEPEMYEPTEYE